MQANPVPIAVLMPSEFPIGGPQCAHDYITVRCPACNATYVLAMPRIAKFTGTLHEKVTLLKAAWGLCGHHPAEIEITSPPNPGAPLLLS